MCHAIARSPLLPGVENRAPNRVLILMLLCFVSSLTACESAVRGFAPQSSARLSRSGFLDGENLRHGRPHREHIEVSPATATLASGRQLQFTVTLGNPDNPTVAWSTTAGTISSDGVFTAPLVTSSKTVIITAQSAAFPWAQATATVTIVTPASPPPPLRITTRSLPETTRGAQYAAPITVSGGQSPYRWTLSAGSLPKGLALDPVTGLVSGSPLQTGKFSFTIGVSDTLNDLTTRALTIAVSSVTTNPGACGPPTYSCSRTDLDVVQVPSSIPAVGNLTGANQVVTDPDFHNPIVRLTDAGTNPNAKNVSFVASAGGSSNANTWNTDSTLIFVQDANATGYPMTFNAATLQAARMYVSTFPQTGGMTIRYSHFSWSLVNPNYLYVLSRTQILLYDFTNRDVPPSPRLVYDFTSSPNCLPSGFTPIWQNFGGVSEGDAAFTIGYSNTGIQGTGVYVVVYSVGKGCSMVNTQTGQITSDWGQSGSMSTPDRFTLHDSFMTKSNGWAMLGRTECLSSSCARGPYFWQVGSTMVTPCGPSGTVQLCSGHWTMGHAQWINNDGDPFGQYHMRSFSGLGSYNPVISALPSGLEIPLDQHPSWNNVDADDSVPFLSSTWSPITPFPTAWYNEIIGISPSSGTVWRFAHSFISGSSQRFSTKYGIGQISQDGRFFLFSSDWMGTLGSESGSPSCTIGIDCRGDVFAVQLR